MTIRRNRALRGAIVGCGNAAVHGHAPVWKTDRHFSIHAVCDPDDARANGFIERTTHFNSISNALEDEELTPIHKRSNIESSSRCSKRSLEVSSAARPIRR